MTARTVLLITHVEEADTVRLEGVLQDRGIATTYWRPFLGETGRLSLDEQDAVICLGGPMGAYETDAHPFLSDEIRLLRKACDRGVPTLGICLGSQLLATALGGKAQPGERGLESGMIRIRTTAEGERMLPEVGDLRYFSFHSDTVEVPPGSAILARSDVYLQAWSRAAAVGIQFHPEMSAAGLDRLIAVEGDKLAKFGIDVAALRREFHTYDRPSAHACERVIGRWLDHHIRRPTLSQRLAHDDDQPLEASTQ